MSKKFTASSQQLKPDAKYNSKLVSKFVNCLMLDGKKSTAQQVFYDAMDIIGKNVKDAEVLIVLDRALSFGGPGGPVCSEIKSALYQQEKRPKIIGFVGGLGGRDISVADFEEIVKRGIEISETGSDQEFEIFGVRE